MSQHKLSTKTIIDGLRYWAFHVDEGQQQEILDELQQQEYLDELRQEKMQKHLAENWGGNPEGKLAKALERARKKSKEPRKPLVIERLKSEWAETFEAESETLKKTSCCCGATKSNPCKCMKSGPMNCSATEPKCPCYQDLEIKASEDDKEWVEVKGFYEIEWRDEVYSPVYGHFAYEGVVYEFTSDAYLESWDSWELVWHPSASAYISEDSPEAYDDEEEFLVPLSLIESAEVYEKKSESFKEWADDEEKVHGDVSFEKWVQEEFEDEPAHRHPDGQLSFIQWSRDEMKEQHHAEYFSEEQHSCPVCGLMVVLVEEDTADCNQCDIRWDIIENKYLDAEESFIKWFEEAEGENCYICGEENLEGYYEGCDNICETCEFNWVYDEGGPEGEGYYLVTSLDEEQRKHFRRYGPTKATGYFVQNIVRNAEDRALSERMTREEAEALAKKVIKMVKPDVDFVEVCGSYRRGREDPGDLDVIIILKEGVTLPEIIEKNKKKLETVNWLGEKKAQTVIDGHKVDFRTTNPKGKGAALLYFTGPAGYNIGMRRRAKKMGLKLNEYGIWDRDSNEYLGGATEEEIYEILGKSYKPPTDRKGAEGITQFNAEDFVDEDIPAGTYVVEWTGGKEEFEWDGGPAMSFNDVWTDILWNDNDITVWDGQRKNKVFGAEPLGSHGW